MQIEGISDKQLREENSITSSFVKHVHALMEEVRVEVTRRLLNFRS
jgi:hypothetical protein